MPATIAEIRQDLILSAELVESTADTVETSAQSLAAIAAADGPLAVASAIPAAMALSGIAKGLRTLSDALNRFCEGGVSS